jgi:hypothetical protein
MCRAFELRHSTPLELRPGLREEKMFVLDGLVTDGLISGDPAHS